MTTRAGVHGGDEGEAGRIGEGGGGAGRGDDPILQGLAERLQRVAAELGPLVETGEARLGGEADSAGAGDDRRPGPRGTPWWARLTSPGRGRLPPPMRPASEME
jgi:hypothetical protein